MRLARPDCKEGDEDFKDFITISVEAIDNLKYDKVTMVQDDDPGAIVLILLYHDKRTLEPRSARNLAGKCTNFFVFL